MLKIKKKEQRTEIKTLLKSMGKKEVEASSKQLYEQLVSSSYWQKADTVLTYLSTEGEVKTDKMIEAALQSGKRLGVPRIQGDDLVFHTVTEHNPAHYVCNQYKIPEPCPERHRVLDEEALRGDYVLLLTPGLAFDREKGRLGKGKGYYDRTIRSLRTLLGEKLVVMGVCFDTQLVDYVVREPWDETVDIVLTEKKAI